MTTETSTRRRREGPAHVTDTRIEHPSRRRSSEVDVPSQGGPVWEIPSRGGTSRGNAARRRPARPGSRPDGIRPAAAGRSGPSGSGVSPGGTVSPRFAAASAAGPRAASPRTAPRVPPQPASPGRGRQQQRGVPGGRPPGLQQRGVPGGRRAGAQLQRRPVVVPDDRAGGSTARAAGTAGSSLGVAAVADSVGRAVPRARFVLLVLALLGGSLVCLLVINTTLGAASFRISQLQKASASLSTQEESLHQQIAAEQSTDAICQRAYALGMRSPASATILDLRSDQIYRLPGQAGMGVQLCAPPAAPAPSKPASTKKSATGRKPAPAASPGARTTPAATRTGTASPSPPASKTPAPTRSSR